MANNKTTIDVNYEDNSVIIEAISTFGAKTRFTIEADGYALIVNTVYIQSSGEQGDDSMSIQPIDKNTVAVFV